MKRTIFVLAMFFLPATIDAGDIDGNYNVASPKGTIGSCGTYVAARDEGRRGKGHKQNLHLMWIYGYLTAYNRRQTPDTYAIAGDQTDNSAILLWLENYCTRKPLARFAEAMWLLTDELHPRRIRKAPK